MFKSIKFLDDYKGRLFYYIEDDDFAEEFDVPSIYEDYDMLQDAYAVLYFYYDHHNDDAYVAKNFYLYMIFMNQKYGYTYLDQVETYQAANAPLGILFERILPNLQKYLNLL